ncbi:MAG: beta-lactamase family protein [Gemmatimonadetes bacterium]|nr:beta-lactamase family protein [Gemmatimonadota bacterium]
MGSVTKQFTAAAILQLVDQGKLALTDPLTKFYPDWPGAGSTVTVAHLLNHTAGIHNYTAMPVFQAWKSRYVPADSMIALFKSAPFDFDSPRLTHSPPCATVTSRRSSPTARTVMRRGRRAGSGTPTIRR